MSAIDRGSEYWTPEPLLDQQTVFILAGGPSLTAADVDRLRGRQVIAINSSCMLAPWAPFLFFTDTSWFDNRRSIVDNWQGIVISTSRQAKRDLPEKIHRIETMSQDEFLVGRQAVKQGRTSGHTAISLSIAMGAVRVVLLGYDMRRVDGRSHFHNEYGSQDDKLFSEDFLSHFHGWGEAARRCGVKVINCTPGSALKEFPMGCLDDELRVPVPDVAPAQCSEDADHE